MSMVAAAAATSRCPGRFWGHLKPFSEELSPSKPRYFTFEPLPAPQGLARPRRKCRRVLYPPVVRRPLPSAEPDVAKRLLIFLLLLVGTQIYNTPCDVTDDVTDDVTEVTLGSPRSTLGSSRSSLGSRSTLGSKTPQILEFLQISDVGNSTRPVTSPMTSPRSLWGHQGQLWGQPWGQRRPKFGSFSKFSTQIRRRPAGVN